MHLQLLGTSYAYLLEKLAGKQGVKRHRLQQTKQKQESSKVTVPNSYPAVGIQSYSKIKPCFNLFND